MPPLLVAMSAAFRREYLVRLPLPLAQLYSRAHNDKTARSRHDCAYYLFEALVKLAAAPAALAYAAEARGGRPRAPRVDELLAKLQRPSQGDWLALLRELARDFARRPDAATHPLGHLWSQLTTERDAPARPGPAQGRDSQSADAAERLPLPSPLSFCDRTMPGRSSSPGRDGGKSRRLPSLEGNSRLERRHGRARRPWRATGASPGEIPDRARKDGGGRERSVET